jgi:hypothetical protein
MPDVGVFAGDAVTWGMGIFDVACVGYTGCAGMFCEMTGVTGSAACDRLKDTMVTHTAEPVPPVERRVIWIGSPFATGTRSMSTCMRTSPAVPVPQRVA